MSLYPDFVPLIISPMHNEASDATRDTRRRKTKRDEHLSPAGKWRSFPKVPHLFQCVSTGQFYGRVKVAGKPIRYKLGTDVFKNATLLLTDFIGKHRTDAGVHPVHWTER